MISSRVPFLNKDGTVSAPWYQFLEGLYPLTSGGPANNSASTADDVLLMHRQDGQGAHDEVRRLANSLLPVRRQKLPKLVLTKETYQPLTLIRLYKGLTANIPKGWQLADGTNGTPNMKDLFVVGAGHLYSQGSSGGSTTIIANNLPAHTHGYKMATANTASNFATTGTATAVTSLTQTDIPSDNNVTTALPYLQPYYALSYIINTSTVSVVTNVELK